MISIIGFGAFGSSLAHVISQNKAVKIYARDQSAVNYFHAHRTNKKYLQNLKFNDNVTVTSNINEIINEKVEMLVLAIPSSALIPFLETHKHLISNSTLIINTAKGLSHEWNCNLNQVITKICPNPTATLVGPSFAQEIVSNSPTEVVVASTSIFHAERLKNVLTTKTFKVTLTSDVKGVEYAAALKNCYAIGAGIIVGLGFSNNSIAKYVTNAFVEQRRFIDAIGGSSEINVATLGDLVMTCYAPLSRNKTFGIAIAKGEKDLGAKTIEGAATIPIVIAIADKYHIDIPFLRAINETLEVGKPSKDFMNLI